MLTVFNHKPTSSLWISLGLFLISTSTLAQMVSEPSNHTKAKSKIRLNLDTIMADPDWMGTSPRAPSWSIDGKFINYARKALGHSHENHYQITVKTRRSSKITDVALLEEQSNRAILNSTKSKGVFAYQGDIYLVDVKNRHISAVTADQRKQSSPTFTSDSQISYLVDKDIFLYDLKTKLERQIASFEMVDDPEEKDDKTYLQKSQPRLLHYLKKRADEKKYQKNIAEHTRLNEIKTWYMGKGNSIKTFRVSPNANWVLVGLTKKDMNGK